MTVNSLISALEKFRDEHGCMDLIVSSPHSHLDTAYLDKGSYEGKVVCFLAAAHSCDLVT